MLKKFSFLVFKKISALLDVLQSNIYTGFRMISDNSTSFENSTLFHEKREEIGITVVVCVLSLVGALGNLLVIATILRCNDLQTKHNSIICSLCFSDLISSVLCSPLWLCRRTWGFENWLWGSYLC